MTRALAHLLVGVLIGVCLVAFQGQGHNLRHLKERRAVAHHLYSDAVHEKRWNDVRHWKARFRWWRNEHVWARAYHRGVPRWGKSWLRSTGACESGGNPRIHGNGGMFHGKYQFVLSTAWAAGFKVDPHLATEHEQDVRAYRWMLRAGRGQWPVCG